MQTMNDCPKCLGNGFDDDGDTKVTCGWCNGTGRSPFVSHETKLTLTLTIDIDGLSAPDVVADLAIDADAGDIDQAALDLVRCHLRKMGDFRDWRIVRAAVTVPETDSNPYLLHGAELDQAARKVGA